MASGAALFLPTVGAAEQFARWGYPDWLRPLTGVLTVGGGFLLIVPRTVSLAAGLLQFVLAFAAFTQLRQGDGLAGPIAFALAGLVVALAAVAYLRRPQALAAARVRAVADAFARREIAREALRRTPSRGRLPARA
jgi:hypothetical protein